MSIEINSKIPVGAGLGSSAALSVVLVKAISDLYEKNLSSEEINDIAYKLEQFSHGTPSGGDNTASCFGNIILFHGNVEKIDIHNDNFVLVFVKKPEKTTGELVQKVRNLDESFRNERINALGDATEEMITALKTNNSKEIKHLMNLTQKILKELSVSCKELDDLAEEVMKINGGAKLSGAGSGGIMLCYHEDKEKLKSRIRELGYIPEDVKLGVEGVRKE